MIRTKFCCNGQNAQLIEPLYPLSIERNNQIVKFYTGAYKCKVCGEITLRGESSQLKAWNTYVQIINEDILKGHIEKRKEYDMAKASTNTIQS